METTHTLKRTFHQSCDGSYILQPQSTGTLSVLQPQSTGTLSTISQGRPTPTMSPPPRVPSAAVSDPFASSPFSIPQSASDIGCAPQTLLTNLRQPHPRRTCSETTTSRTLRPLLFRTSRRKLAMSRTSLTQQTVLWRLRKPSAQTSSASCQNKPRCSRACRLSSLLRKPRTTQRRSYLLP